VVNVSDLPGFVTDVLAGQPTCRADMNHDGKVDGVDVRIFTDTIVP
jgi:hypothetical protein